MEKNQNSLDIKSKIDRFIELQQEAQELLDNGLKKYILGIVKEYLEATNDSPGNPSTADYNFKIDIYSMEIYGSWEETWRYGGYDGSSFRFPLSYIYDPSKIENLKKEKEDKENKRKLLLEQRQIDEEKKQYLLLKEKYDSSN